jgi:hypothetical protein
MNKLSFLLLAVFSSALLFGQSTLMNNVPVEMKQAYQNGTRTLSGVPGAKYWQNHAKYQINAEAVLSESLIKGTETVTYFNNSPDTLKRLVVRLYPNIYKKGNPREWPVGADAANDGMVLNNLIINGDTIDLNDRRQAYLFSTNLYVTLPAPLAPGDSLQMNSQWQFEVSEHTLRMGNYGNNKYFIAYWYPQIAVYDDIDGWDEVEYLGSVEFYNDFNDYDVHIAAPPGYVVWATGKLVNEREMFTDYVLDNLATARITDGITHIFSVQDFKKTRKIIRHDGINAFHTNDWHFKAEHVPDFTFAVRRDVNWDGTSLIVDENSKRRVFVDVVYGDSARSFQDAARWARASVEYMSYDLPGYPFPYEHITTVSNGNMGGGMESPMMANNGDPKDSVSSALTIFHEISHNYFPFYMGTNERKYAWMDEGWAAYLTSIFSEKYFPDNLYSVWGIKSFESENGKERESTLMTLSYNILDYNSYRIHAYVRPALAYGYLRDALGDSLYKTALHAYMNRWHGKHPVPYDFFNTFNDVTNSDLSWFFIPWFFEKATADLGIKKVTNDNKIVVQNVGGLPLPVIITCEFADGTTEVIRKSPAVWSSGENAVVLQVDKDKMLRKVTLGSELVPDINKKNNVVELGSN